MAQTTFRQLAQTFEKPLSALFFFLYSIAVLYYFSASSPKLDFNPCPSPNMYLTIGQAMFDGLVPYRDLFDGKGIPIFFFNGIGGLIDNHGYTGQWLVTCVFFAWTLYYMNRTARLFLSTAHAVTATLLASFLLLTGGRMYITGAMGDEFTMPMIMMSIYYFLCLNPEQKQTGKLFILGILGGFLLACKFTLAAFWFVLMGCHLLLAWRQKGFKTTAALGLPVAGGIACIIGTCAVYFACNHALDSYAYGYIEFHTYHAAASLGERIRHFQQGAMDFLDCTALMAIGLLYWAILPPKENTSWISRLSIPAAGIIMFAAVYAGASFSYYYLSLMPFVLFGIIYLLRELNTPSISFPRRIAAILCLALCIFLTTRTTSPLLSGKNHDDSNTLPAIQEKKAQLLKLAALIDKENPHPSILCYGCFDNGIYRMLGITPNVTHYQVVNFDPKGKEAQKSYIRERRCDYVFILSAHPDNLERKQTDTLLRQYYYTPISPETDQESPWILYKKADLPPAIPAETTSPPPPCPMPI